MATIGAYTVLIFDGRLRPAVQKIAVIESAPGVDGVAVIKGGWTNSTQAVRTVTEASSASAAALLLQQYRAMHGLVVTVVDQFGFTWPNVTVIGVTGVIAAKGVSGVYRVEMQWSLLPDTTRPPGV
jgi:hypothetical protein